MHDLEFLHRLGLDQSADERAIKRAYARELKLIDQEADSAGFQLLREAYETSLYWLQHQPARPSVAPAAVPVMTLKAHGQQAPAAAAAPARDAYASVDPRALAAAEFDEFLAACAEVAAKGDERDPALWRKQLQRSANGERLLNISARAHFEYMIAHLLAEGWRPGHEGLFAAARQVFSWDRDSRRLLEFGQLGGWINQAIEESAMFAHQTSDDCSSQTDALIRVRDTSKPGARELMTHVPHLRNMVARFPAWTSIIASAEQIKQWIALEQEIPGWRRPFHRERAVAANDSGGSVWWKVVLCLMVVRALFSVFDSPSVPSGGNIDMPFLEQAERPMNAKEAAAEAAYQRAAGGLYMPPGTRTLDPLLLPDPNAALLYKPAAQPPKPLVPKGRFLNDAEMQKIFDRVDYKASPDVKAGSYKVPFQVDLDERGAIQRISLKTPSGLPDLDRKAEQAIRDSAPFGNEIQRNFGLVLTMTFFEREKKAPSPPPPEPAQPAPAQVAPEPSS